MVRLRGFLVEQPFPAPEVASAGDWLETIRQAGPANSDAYDDTFRALVVEGKLTMIDDLADVSLS